MPLTAAQIVTQACQNAKVPGFTSQAGQLLNLVLQDLCQNYDFDIARSSTLINVGTNGSNPLQGPYSLPSDYLRTRYNGAFYQINGVPYTLINIPLEEYDRLVQQAGINNYPEMFATDMGQSPPVMYFWPPPSGVFPTTVRYQRQMPDITTPETSSAVPWFPNQEYLIAALSAKLCAISDDERMVSFENIAMAKLEQYLKLKDDKEGYAQRVRLDRRQFAGQFKTLPNTKTIGW